MTTPSLSVPIRRRGRHYPYPPCDVSTWPRNQWGSVDPDNIPPDVDVLPSVTNILTVCDKPALKGWAAERALIELYDSGNLPTSPEVAIDRHKMAFDRYSKQRAAAGTRAHTLAERLTRDLPLPTSISDEDEAYADAYLKFWSDHDPEPLHVEATIYDTVCGYAGTADLLARIDGHEVTVDYKTRRERDDSKIRRYGLLYDEARMQLAALGYANELALPDGDLDEIEMPRPGLGVVLFPDGSYASERVERDDLDRWYLGFLGALDLWRAKKGVPA